MKIIDNAFTSFRRPILISGLIVFVLILAGCLSGRFSDKLDSPEDESPLSGLIPDYFPSDDPALNPPDKYTSVGLNPGEFIYIYSEPKSEAVILGEIPSGITNINSSGESLEQGHITWILAEYGNTQGWVDSKYLAVQKGEIPKELVSFGWQVLDVIRRYDYNQLANLVHPDHCLRLSPYSYLAEDDLVICPAELREIKFSDEYYTWGKYDGTGDPIKLKFGEYHTYYIYDAHYFRPEIVGFNVKVSAGNAINNINEVYPDGLLIEYYFSGSDPQYLGMDWSSLTLVFVKDNQTWYPVAIVHGQWTI